MLRHTYGEPGNRVFGPLRFIYVLRTMYSPCTFGSFRYRPGLRLLGMVFLQLTDFLGSPDSCDVVHRPENRHPNIAGWRIQYQVLYDVPAILCVLLFHIRR